MDKTHKSSNRVPVPRIRQLSAPLDHLVLHRAGVGLSALRLWYAPLWLALLRLARLEATAQPLPLGLSVHAEHGDARRHWAASAPQRLYLMEPPLCACDSGCRSTSRRGGIGHGHAQPCPTGPFPRRGRLAAKKL